MLKLFSDIKLNFIHILVLYSSLLGIIKLVMLIIFSINIGYYFIKNIQFYIIFYHSVVSEMVSSCKLSFTHKTYYQNI